MKLYSSHSSSSAYSIRTASLEDALKIYEIMVLCSQTLEDIDYFICDDLEYVKNILNQNGFGIVACDTTGTVVGNLLVKYPGISEENLGYDIFLPAEKPSFITKGTYSEFDSLYTIPLCNQTLEKVVHMDSSSVLPEHRGHGLENRMIAFAETLIDRKKYHYSFATVAPKNTASLRSLQKNGYQIVLTKEKYGGFQRHIMMKNFTPEVTLHEITQVRRQHQIDI